MEPPANPGRFRRKQHRRGADRSAAGKGAGRGHLSYDARYVDANRTVIAEIKRSEEFTGFDNYESEYGEGIFLGGPRTVQSVLVQEAAKHIAQLAVGQPQPLSKTQMAACDQHPEQWNGE